MGGGCPGFTFGQGSALKTMQGMRKPFLCAGSKTTGQAHPPPKDNIHTRNTCTRPHICVNLCTRACVRKYTHKHAPTTLTHRVLHMTWNPGKEDWAQVTRGEAGSCHHCPSQQAPGIALSCIHPPGNAF